MDSSTTMQTQLVTFVSIEIQRNFKTFLFFEADFVWITSKPDWIQIHFG